jgi:RND family efflux transporter MFP subunit
MIKITKLPRFAKWIILPVALMVVLYFFIQTKPSISEESEGESAKLEELEAEVTTEPIKTGELPVIMKSMGTCVADRQSAVVVVARIQGIVKEVNVLDGQQVEKGQIIARLDDSVVKGNYEKAHTALQTAEAELKNAEKGGLEVMQGELDLAAKDSKVAADKAQLESKHEDELLADRLTSEKAARDSKAAMELAVKKSGDETKKAELFRDLGRDMELKRLKAAVAQAQSELRSAQWDLDSTVLRAPVKGRVGALKVSAGAPVEASTIIAQMNGSGATAFRLWISPQNIKDITVGYPVTVYPLLSGNSIPAKIVSVGGGIDEETGLAPVEAQPDQENIDLRLNEAVTADITTGQYAKGFLVPVSSITISDDKASVYVVDDKMIAHAVSVTVLSRGDEQAVIVGEGLKEGSQIITDGNYNLPDGAHVKRGEEQ